MSAAPGWRHDFVLAFLPVPGITPAVETGNHHNPVLLNLEEYSIGEAPHSRTAKVAIDNSELQWLSRDCRNRGLDRKGKTFPQFGADVVIPCPRFKQILVRLRYPDDRECHGFLERPARTCSQGTTSEGFCS